MGLAKFVVGKSYTTCGTPDYFCPELIAAKGHNVAVDWWTIGILIYELQSGNPPFESDNPMQTYAKINQGFDKVKIHEKCKDDVEEICRGFLRPDPADRLGMPPNGVNAIKEQTFFKSFDWPSMEDCTMTPPYKPQVKNPTDLSNFKARPQDKPPQINYRDDKTGWDKDFATST